MVNARGGTGIPIRVDHTIPAEVQGLFDRIHTEQNRLDILVNDISGEEVELGTPFWKLSIAKVLKSLESAVYTHIITSRFGVPLMIETNSGLIVEVTDGVGYYYRGNLSYDLAKMSTIRLAFAMATELRHKNITAVAMTPGFIRSEAMLNQFGVTEETWRSLIGKYPNIEASETPYFVSRAVAALAADSNVRKKSGRVYSSWALAKEYGFTDIDGTQPNIEESTRILFNLYLSYSWMDPIPNCLPTNRPTS